VTNIVAGVALDRRVHVGTPATPCDRRMLVLALTIEQGRKIGTPAAAAVRGMATGAAVVISFRRASRS
jgi:hypothetical protein